MNDIKDLPIVKHLELLQLAQSVIASKEDQLLKRYPHAERMLFLPRFYHLNFSNATLTWVINAFGICDISFLDFDTIADIAICRYLCRNHYKQVKNDLWVTQDILIEYSKGVCDNSFRFGWRHDEILCHFD